MTTHWMTGRAARTFPPFAKWIALLCLIPIFLAACTSTDLEPVFVTDLGGPSPTPFQPPLGQYDSPYGISVTPPVGFPPTASTSDSPSLNLSVDINPLTGLPPANPVLLERRPLAIKISNYPREIRPQYGLTLADQVFEYYIEWGDTRFIAIFYGNDSKQVGPVRSGRFFDEHITRMYRAFYVFNYADPREWNYFKDSDLYPFLVIPGCVNCACPPFFVSNANQLPDERHLANYFDTTRFYECNAKKGVNNSRQPIRNGFFSEAIPDSDTLLNRIYISYSERDYHYWEYDPQTLRYIRFQETVTINSEAGIAEAYAPLMDAATSQQVSAENMVILFVSHTFANKFNAEDEVYDIHLVDSGKAYVFRDGVAIPARWVRTEKEQPLFLTTLDGNPIFLRPGRTFYEVIGLLSTTFQDEAGWHFQFQTP